MQISGSIRCCLISTASAATAVSIVEVCAKAGTVSAEADVLEIDRLAIDADRGRRDPAGELAGLDDAAHQRADERAVGRARQPFGLVRLPLVLADDAPLGRHADAGERADLAVERLVRDDEPLRQAGLVEHLVPA